LLGIRSYGCEISATDSAALSQSHAVSAPALLYIVSAAPQLQEKTPSEMTPTDVVFRYGSTPGEREVRALDSVREVYGIRRISFDEKQRTVRVEYDASRLKEDVVGSLLRRAGLDVRDRVQLV
jgi:hypothetical protein